MPDETQEYQKMNLKAEAIPATAKNGSAPVWKRFWTSKKAAWICVFIWMAVIFAFSAQAHSGEITAEYFGDYNFSVRKTAHMCEYGFLLFLIRHALVVSGSRWNRLPGLLALTMCFLYAMSDEFHQLFVPGRSAQFNDVLIDTTGSAISWALHLCVAFVRSKIRQK